MPPPLTVPAQLSAIADHSAGFARAARDHLEQPVEHCPGWSVADLVAHLGEVHWFWATIVEERLQQPPAQDRRPARAADAELVDTFERAAARLVRVLADADQSEPCWTWAGWAQHVGFVTRHQVQEAAVHHWDAAHATGLDWSVGLDVAADAVDEFLHFSVASDDDPDDPVRPPLDGTLGIRATDTGDTWTLTDGPRPGTVAVTDGADPRAPVVEAPVADLLLWLYGRVQVDTAPVPPELVARLGAMISTD